ncbi:MAG TPA: chemotaxis-specific protein-glutamate methyltransferase CheB [Verrucomicrobiae bacterium]|nr:chemotaxis-specific protein-glutamate methyltransferase CheB [Verrucomicrobiae bacterium]
MIRILLADDSQVTRAVLRDIFAETCDLRVIGEAVNGAEAVVKTDLLKPDLVIMDINMPVMNGLDAIGEIMARSPVPILVLSAAGDTKNVDLAFNAIKLGALDVMHKPAGLGDELRETERALLEKVRMLSRIKVIRHHRRRQSAPFPPAEPRVVSDYRSILAIGASTGGPKAVLSIMRALPAGFPATVFVVQHIANGFAGGFTQWLNRECSLPVRMATEGEKVAPGVALVAPDNRHMHLEGGRIRLSDGAAVNCCRPSIDVFFRSLAEESPEKTVAVLLTGMGRDGADGMRLLRDRGAATIVQDEETSAVFGMPKAAIAMNAADHVLPLGNIPDALLNIFNDRRNGQ